MSRSPHVQCPPLLLHESGGIRCWATAVTTPLGLSVTVCVQAPSEAELRRVTSEEYNSWGSAVNMAGRAPETPTGLLLLPFEDWTATAHYSHFLAPAEIGDPEPEWILDILFPGLKRSAYLRPADPEGPSYPATYVVPPAVLHEDDTWLLWHEGIIRTQGGLYGVAGARKRPGSLPLWDSSGGEGFPLSGAFRPTWDTSGLYFLDEEHAILTIFAVGDMRTRKAEIVLRPAGKKFTLRW
ncbi:hypothetical protein ACFC63_01515 [Streptomyces albidoflavus]